MLAFEKHLSEPSHKVRSCFRCVFAATRGLAKLWFTELE